MAKGQMQLSFLEEEIEGIEGDPVWSTLNNEQRAEVVATLARLIAKLAAADHSGKENDDNE